MAQGVEGRVLWPGQGAGPVHQVREPQAPASAPPVAARGAEISRLQAAFAAVREELEGLLRLHRQSGDEWLHFRVLLTALEEEALWVWASRLIDQEGWPAPAALLRAAEALGDVFATAQDELEQDHWRYLKAASQWVYRWLQGLPGPTLARVPKGAMVLAHDLPPFELLLLEPGQVAGVLLTSADPWLGAGANPTGVPVVYGLPEREPPQWAAILPGGRVIFEPEPNLVAELQETEHWVTSADGQRWAIWPLAGQPLAGRYRGPWTEGLPLVAASWPDLAGLELLGPGPESLLIDLRPLGAELDHPGARRLLWQAVATARGQGRPVGLAGVGEVAPLPLAIALGVDAFAAAPPALLALRRALAQLEASAYGASSLAEFEARLGVGDS